MLGLGRRSSLSSGRATGWEVGRAAALDGLLEWLGLGLQGLKVPMLTSEGAIGSAEAPLHGARLSRSPWLGAPLLCEALRDGPLLWDPLRGTLESAVGLGRSSSSSSGWAAG